VVEPRLLAGIIGLTGGLLGLAIATYTYLTLKPGLDLVALLTPPALVTLVIAYDITGRFKVDLTPIAAAPLAYTLHHTAAIYLREAEAVDVLAYSITLGASITLLTISPAILATRRRALYKLNLTK
jgi:hypothetical protein